MTPIDIVIFTCTGRENLLRRTIESFDQDLIANSGRKILAIDGPFELDTVRKLPIDLVLHSQARTGYISSIGRALRAVETPRFLWLEDDWDLSCITSRDLKHADAFLEHRSEFAQVRWPKDMRAYTEVLSGAIRNSTAGFSANPNLAKTSAMLTLFDDLSTARTVVTDLPPNLGFETFCTDAMERRGLRSAVFDCAHTGIVGHLGDFESTDRKWHYVAKQDTDERARINRFGLLLRFLFSAGKVATSIPFNRRMSEIAFRFVNLLRAERS